MAFLDPNEAFEHFRDRSLEGIRSQFPIKGRLASVTLEGLDVRDQLSSDDIQSQYKAKVSGSTWAVPVYASLALRDNKTNQILEKKQLRIAELPKVTSRYSFIVGGQEYQVDNQWQLKPGAYVKRDRNNEIVTKFNVVDRNPFDVRFEPDTKVFKLVYNKSNVPLYPLLKTMGIDDHALEKTWGKDILDANRKARGAATALDKFYRTAARKPPESKEEAEKFLLETMQASRVRPDATEVTLGKAFDHINGDALHRATNKMLKVQSGHPEDDRDSLQFKDFRAAGDFAFDRLRGAQKDIQLKARRQLERGLDKVGLRDIVKFDLFNAPIMNTFHGNSAARPASQINPVEMVSAAFQTTIMGPGGIQSEHGISDEAKFVNPSHFGFLDALHTPEGDKTGVTLRLPIGVRKVGMAPHIPLFNVRTGKTELVPPHKALASNVVLPDQIEWKNGKPSPLNSVVKMMGPGNTDLEGKFNEADYVMRHSSQLFSMSSNLIPFLGNTSGNRASMAGRHIEQSISLVNRETPLVQSSTGAAHDHISTFEKLLGRQSSHQAQVDGKVLSVNKDAIVVQTPKGEKHTVHLYNNYPLNDAKSVMTSTALVKPGDHVKAGQVVADTNFSKGGDLALGTNLRVAFIPYRGYNFEDGVVISESAAKKLASQHLYKESMPVSDDLILNKKSFQTFHLGAFAKDQLEKLDDRGIVRVGQRVHPGDPLIVATRKFDIKDRTGRDAIRRAVSNRYNDASLRWDSDHEGEVVGIHQTPKGLAVHVKTVEPMQVGDKIAGRYGNKGIVSLILPDKEMPKTGEGHHIEVALNPSGIPGRMNVGQVLETAASKIAIKTGKPYVVQNFQPGVDMLEKIQGELKKHGLSDTEHLTDPVTNQPLGQALVGHQHMLKLVHQVDKKLSVRSGMSLPGLTHQEHYDQELQPTGGGGAGGQSIGALGLYALLSHGATANIREMQTWKSEGRDPREKWQSQHGQVWNAIQFGTALPTPKTTFAFQKFTDMLRGSGINIEKKGNDFVLTPLTDRHIKELASEGEGANRKLRVLTKPTDIVLAKLNKAGDPAPRPGGLFDEKLTGGHGGTKWSAINLAEPVPNPIFEGPIKSLTGLSSKDFTAIMHGERSIDPMGRLTDVNKGITGGAAIKSLLQKVDVKKELTAAEKALNDAPKAKVDTLLKKVKYLRALDQLSMKPADAYVLHHLPVVPPVMRGVSVLPSGDLNWGDMNRLYSDFAKVNDKLQNPVLAQNLTDAGKQTLRRDFYDGVRAIAGIGTKYESAKHKGLLHQISGVTAKSGYFQDTLLNKRQDLTMRATITPEPALGIDEVGLPQHSALKLFSPFVVNRLMQMGIHKAPLDAQKEISKAISGKESSPAWKALDHVMAERPVLLKRDPALHKYSVQSFMAKPVKGNSIHIHPLVCGGFNADFDGDTMSVFVPIHHEAVAEARKMFPSNNIFNEATGRVEYSPTLESALGLYKLSLTGKQTKHTFKTTEEVIAATKSGKLSVTDVVKLGDKTTTPGRVLMASALPDPMKAKVLHDFDHKIDKKGLATMLTTLGQNHQGEFGNVINKLKDLGNDTSFGVIRLSNDGASGHRLTTMKTSMGTGIAAVTPSGSSFIPIGTHTLSLKDFTPDKANRDPVVAAARKKIDILRKGNLDHAERERQEIGIWTKASNDIKNLHEKKLEKDPDNLFLMYKAGVKPGWDQYKQLKIGPMLLKDSADRTIPTPVARSYAEGLDVQGYWTQTHGARRGSVMKVQEVREPGYMSKLLMNNMMHIQVADHDCKTNRGISLSVNEQDIHDRHLAKPFHEGKLKLSEGTLLTPDIISQIRSVKKNAEVIVRSPLRCEHGQGVCQRCAGISSSGGYHSLGTNIGVQAAHAVGERAVQLTLKSFHTGGTVEHGGGKLLNSFARFEQLTKLPSTIPNAASLAMTTGKIDKIEPDSTGAKIWVNGLSHHVAKDPRGLALHTPVRGSSWAGIRVGDQVKAGDFLSDPDRTYVNPHDLYRATGKIETVQNRMTQEIHDLYKDEGIKRRHVETLVKAMSDLAQVHDPGDHSGVLRGEFKSVPALHRMNSELGKQGKKPIMYKPVLKGVEALPLALQEDWMAKLQHQRLTHTLLDAAATNAKSSIHGPHPVPGAAFGAQFGHRPPGAKTGY